ncbi:hypothetical protein AB3R30_18750 [Leptolyngbyaceae cyanobacterium UHCC 1019]
MAEKIEISKDSEGKITLFVQIEDMPARSVARKLREIAALLSQSPDYKRLDDAGGDYQSEDLWLTVSEVADVVGISVRNMQNRRKTWQGQRFLAGTSKKLFPVEGMDALTQKQLRESDLISGYKKRFKNRILCGVLRESEGIGSQNRIESEEGINP